MVVQQKQQRNIDDRDVTQDFSNEIPITPLGDILDFILDELKHIPQSEADQIVKELRALQRYDNRIFTRHEYPGLQFQEAKDKTDHDIKMEKYLQQNKELIRNYRANREIFRDDYTKWLQSLGKSENGDFSHLP